MTEKSASIVLRQKGNLLCYINERTLPWLVWLSWLEHCPVNREVTGLMLYQKTYLGCSLVPSWGVWERQLVSVSLSHNDVSLPLSPSLPLSLRSVSMSSGEDMDGWVGGWMDGWMDRRMDSVRAGLHCCLIQRFTISSGLQL